MDGQIDEGFVDTDYDGVKDCVDDDDDNDFLTDQKEDTLGTDPLNKDTDGDGYRDGYEDSAQYDPLDAASHPPQKPPPYLDLPEPESGALFGYAVENVGDIDDGGDYDFLVSAPLKMVNGEKRGRVYLFAGPNFHVGVDYGSFADAGVITDNRAFKQH